MKAGGVEKAVLIFDMFENVEHQDDVECRHELRRAIVYVVAIDFTAPAHIVAQGVFVQIESRGREIICVLDLTLQDPVAAANLRDPRSLPQQASGELLKYIEAAPAPEMRRRGQIEIPFRHDSRERLRFEDDP